MAQGHPVRNVVQRLGALSDRKTITLGELVEAFGSASFVPALMVPALLVVSPLSGIPVFSSVCGLTIALIALQMVLSRRFLWLPGWIRRRRLKGGQLGSAVRRLTKLADWLDRHSRARLRVLVEMPGGLVPRIAAALCGAAMPFLELVPFSSSILGTAVLLFSVSFLARDGLYVLAGLIVMAIATTVPVLVWGQILG